MQYKICEKFGKKALEIDLGGITIPEIEGKEVLLDFPIYTYTKMDEESFLAINNFFDYISNEDKRIIIIYLVTMHLLIRERIGSGDSEQAVPLSQELGQMMMSLDSTINLYKKMVEFSSKHIPINVIKDAGNRPQDTAIKTYLYQDIVELMGCVLISKMMTPIYGTMMHYGIKYDVVCVLKEMLCLPIVMPLFHNVCPHVIYKLKENIKSYVNKSFTENIETISENFTTISIINHIFTNIIVRNFINLDIYKEGSNHITALYVGIKQVINTKIANGKKNRVMIRENKSMGNDESKNSYLEDDSIISYITPDIPIIADVFIDRTVTKFLKEYNIPRELYEETYRFNLSNNINYTINNALILEILFSGHMSGTNSIKYLKVQSMCKLISIAQLICFMLGYNEIGHSITAINTGAQKAQLSETDRIIAIGYTNKSGYLSMLSTLNEMSLAKDLEHFFSIRIKEIIEIITTNVFVFQTAPCIWKEINSPDNNKKDIQFTEDFINQLCNMINRIIQNVNIE